MHMLIPTIPHNSQPSSHNGPAICGTGSTMSVSALPPIVERDGADFFFSPQPSLLVAEHAGYNLVLASILEQVARNIPYLYKDAASDPPLRKVDPPQFRPTWVPEVSHHASGLRLRLTTAGFHSRRPKGFAWFHFFPRSVGFGPTASSANGAFTIVPSMLCHRQAIPSISSYSASPLRHRRTKTPFRFHSKKYWWMELALPNTAFGSAFHWHPVRRTYMMPSKTLWGSMGLRPPPGRRKYFFRFFRLCCGINGSTRFQSSSDTVHAFTALMENLYHDTFWRSTIIYG